MVTTSMSSALQFDQGIVIDARRDDATSLAVRRRSTCLISHAGVARFGSEHQLLGVGYSRLQAVAP